MNIQSSILASFSFIIVAVAVLIGPLGFKMIALLLNLHSLLSFFHSQQNNKE
eukprot:m.9337 g.9337  ORF g.9337 m.9337 type:complete len:52 (-) comp6324_c0_seq1:7-162(-)